jgi:hypothetical protein
VGSDAVSGWSSATMTVSDRIARQTCGAVKQRVGHRVVPLLQAGVCHVERAEAANLRG